MEFTKKIVNEFKHFSGAFDPTEFESNNSGGYAFFPWSADFEAYVRELKENHAWMKLARVYELTSVCNRTLLEDANQENIYSHYIAAAMMFCAGMYYYAAGQRISASATVKHASLQLHLAIDDLDLRDPVKGVIYELLGDLHLLINHHALDRYYELAEHHFEQQPDEEGGETHDWYWNVCAFEMLQAVELVLGVRHVPADLKGYTKRIEIKRRLKKVVELDTDNE